MYSSTKASYDADVDIAIFDFLRRCDLMRMQVTGNRPLTLREAADALGLSIHTVRAWIARKQIKHVRLGRAIRILPGDVEELLRKSTVQARGGAAIDGSL